MNRYDFDLKTGKSETGLVACTYAVEVKHDSADDLDKVYVETPKGGTHWRLVELRPVSEGSSPWLCAWPHFTASLQNSQTHHHHP